MRFPHKIGAFRQLLFLDPVVYFVYLLSVCLLISVRFFCLPEMINKDEYKNINCKVNK